MKHSDGYLDLRHSKARGTSHLYRQSWYPEGEARAAIVLIHGLGEHSGRYRQLAAFCTDRGFAVHALDHYGHGKSDGQPGHVERFSVFVDGVRALLQHVHESEPGLPLFLLGHSMGGLIAATYLEETQAGFRGCVLSGPAFRTPAAPAAIVRWLNQLLSWLAPTAPMIALDPRGVSRDPEVVRAYVRDPLVFHGKLSARLIAEMMHAMPAALAHAGTIELPILILHGEDDVLTAPAGSRAFFESVGAADKTLKLYPTLFHEIFNEPERETVLTDMTEWLEGHL